jgi:hypothetical protein
MEMIGKALDIGRAETLPIPPWAVAPFSARVVDPLDMYAGSRMMAFGISRGTGHRIMPWQKRRMSRNANAVAQGRGMLYSPLGVGSTM